jgi:hypothetical protein
MPSYLDKTLVGCVLLWAGQKLVHVWLLKRHQRPAANPPLPADLPPRDPDPVEAPKNKPSDQVQTPAGLDEKLLEYIRQKGKAGTGELAKALEVSPRTVNYCQKKLLIEGRLVREGKGKAAVYRLKE